MDGVELDGDKDIFGREFKSADLATARNLGMARVGGLWFGRSLTGGTGATSVVVPITPLGGSHLVGSHLVGSRVERQDVVGTDVVGPYVVRAHLAS